MPVFMWSESADEDLLQEFDWCGLCGKSTSLLVYVRWEQTLSGICGECVSGLREAYQEMLRRRERAGTAGRASYE